MKCNITQWDDQVGMFDTAIEKSPNRSCDIVIANAGISRSSGDSLWRLDGRFHDMQCHSEPIDHHTDPDGPPAKPELNVVNVNLTGTLYTFKLAVHYFRKQSDTAERDRCFIMTGSMTTWIDSPVQYTVIQCRQQRSFHVIC